MITSINFTIFRLYEKVIPLDLSKDSHCRCMSSDLGGTSINVVSSDYFERQII